LREISTLASWTVSSSKPGCSVPQLRSPSTSLFWQSDGPQPHYLNIHFFKLVRIVGLRLYLDFDLDESYTPTRIIFLAGSGNNDLVEWGEMKLEQPRGWVWADFSGMPVLRAHLVQIKILENHQNGKDTHLRGLQVFAKDNERDKAPKVKAFLGSEGKAKAEGRKRRGRGDDGLDFGLGRMKRAEWDGEGMIR
ncbi:galactose-binding like protein, partial [Corynespora cassiicola Philippines]